MSKIDTKNRILDAAEVLFGGDPTAASADALAVVAREVPSSKVTKPLLDDLFALLQASGLASSNGDARRGLQQKAFRANGQVLEEGITEAGSMASFIAAGSAYATRGVPTIPFYTFYSMFGFQRIGDLVWQAADARVRGFLMGATAGRTTLLGEGLQNGLTMLIQRKTGELHKQTATILIHCQTRQPIRLTENQSTATVCGLQIEQTPPQLNSLLHPRQPECGIQWLLHIPRIQSDNDSTVWIVQPPCNKVPFSTDQPHNTAGLQWLLAACIHMMHSTRKYPRMTTKKGLCSASLQHYFRRTLRFTNRKLTL